MDEKRLIRRFEQGDLPRLHEIREAAYLTIFLSLRGIVGEEIAPFAFGEAEQEQGRFLDSICTADAHHEVYVVETDAGIVAFFSISLNQESKVGELDLNAVHPDHQGDGIGTWMYEFALNRMTEAGMAVATVGTGGDPSHAPARRAYEKAGFGPSLPTVWLYKDLQ